MNNRAKVLAESRIKLSDIVVELLSKQERKERYVIWVRLGDDGSVAQVQFKFDDKTVALPVKKVVKLIDEDEYSFFACRFMLDPISGEPSIKKVPIITAKRPSGTGKYIRTGPDETKKDNLPNLPKF